MMDEDITGTFYQSELLKVEVDSDQLRKVDKIIRTKSKGPGKQYLVKRKYYPTKLNSWVKDIQ